MAQCKYTLKLHSSSCKSVTRQPPLLYLVSMRLNLTHLGDQLFDGYGMSSNRLAKGQHIFFHFFQNFVRLLNVVDNTRHHIFRSTTFRIFWLFTLMRRNVLVLFSISFFSSRVTISHSLSRSLYSFSIFQPCLPPCLG